MMITSEFNLGFGLLSVLMIFIMFGFKNKISNTDQYEKIEKEFAINDTGITGEELFLNNCSACHGVNREGNMPTFPSLQQIDKKMSKKEIGTLLTTGRNMMPNFSHLSGSERGAIVNFLYGEKTVADQVTEVSSIDKGKNIFVANCVRCHNTTIAGSKQNTQRKMGMQPPYIGGISNKYNENQFKSILNMGPCYMPSFSEMADTDKEDVYSFLSSLDGSPYYANRGYGRGCRMQTR